MLRQPSGRVVHNDAGRTVIPCRAGHTLGFEIDWLHRVDSDPRSAIGLFAINGVHERLDQQWQQSQGGWRRTT